MKNYINIIGGGLAGSEAAYQIAKRGIKVKLYEMKPEKFSPAHQSKNLAEIVCSNSFKSNLHTNACGLLKEELRMLDSLLIKIADKTSVPAGQALAVDREMFSELVTKELEQMPNVEIIRKEVGCQENRINDRRLIDKGIEAIKEQDLEIEKMAKDGIVIICTGPLTSDALSQEISKITGEDKLHFYDAAAPIVEKDSIDMSIAFWGDRYEQERKRDESIEEWQARINGETGSESRKKEETGGNSGIKQQEASYLNLPMNEEEYNIFWKELVEADVVTLHEFEKREIFEGCMPIEIMAKRGKDTLRFGPLKPVGFTDPRTGRRPYAVVQLRQDNSQGNLFNIVGFQTNLKFGEQKRVLSLIPGMKEASFVKYGVMHRNTYINSTKLLDATYQLKKNTNIYFAGQITGVEGYVESISSGLVAGINAVNQLERENKNIIEFNMSQQNEKNVQSLKTTNNEKIVFSKTTMIGALADYISTPNDKFQPMNANFGILPALTEKIRDKKLKYGKLSDRALEEMKTNINKIKSIHNI